MCVSTRFPEAIPLRNIKAKTIVEALTKFFTLVGLPKSIQSDQGSNFTSGLFQQIMHELGIKQYTSSAYHPESQGALERFHQTLKQMIKTYCFETEKDWDDGVHFLLFAARESVQESLGFSPFELVFGHTVRGPLKLLKEKLLTDDGGSLNILQYVTDFRTKLTKACDLARKNLKTAQNRMKHSYDSHKNTVTRNFQNGDKVLALLPVPGNPLQARYFGPYVIEKKENDLNYIIITPNRRRKKQLCHVNMLKAYHERKKVVQSVNVVSSDRDRYSNEDESELSSLSETTKLSNSDVLRNMDSKLSHLQPSQRQDVLDLVNEYAQLFPDIPSRTDMISHDVDIGDASPIKQHPYRLNSTKAKYLDQEIQYLLENDFIEHSQSSWSSPCILVPKPDGSYRMCTDYRKVNNLTKSDNFPIPRMDDCVDKIGNAKYVSKFDLLKGFWQIPLSERAKEVSAFVTPRGLYQYKVMPFGMRNAPATFQRLINQIISQIDGCEGYIDDVIIYSDTWEEHLEILRKFFKRLSEAKLTISTLYFQESSANFLSFKGEGVTSLMAVLYHVI
ncbi:Transposon Ty3-I Gag-Pol poly [Paramuricea clavata]|nr:Transposon Ty3-I Gag-Pol poly [Paramuricea clavata]